MHLAVTASQADVFRAYSFLLKRPFNVGLPAIYVNSQYLHLFALSPYADAIVRKSCKLKN